MRKRGATDGSEGERGNGDSFQLADSGIVPRSARRVPKLLLPVLAWNVCAKYQNKIEVTRIEEGYTSTR